MCQLTLIDFEDTRLSRFAVRPLTEINALGIGAQYNLDGFGYVCFTNLDSIEKTHDEAAKFWENNASDFRKKHRNPNGIYHVRACSPSNKLKTEDKHSHPFFTENLILAHNGTLSRRLNSINSKLYTNVVDISENIDSENFLLVLDEIVNKDKENPYLTANNIQTAIKEWSGSFAFIIVDKRNPKSIFIAKDNEKKLHKAVFKVGKKKIGIIINTMAYELGYVAELICGLADAFEMKLTYEIEELDKDKIWIYSQGTYDLDKPVLEISRIFTSIVTPSVNRNNNIKHNTMNKNGPSFERVANYIIDMRLNYLEVVVMTEILFGQNFFTFDGKMMEVFADFLEQLEHQHNYKGRQKAWQKVREHYSLIDAYEEGIPFPYILNSVKDLKKFIK